MLQSTRLQRVRHNLVIEQQQQREDILTLGLNSMSSRGVHLCSQGHSRHSLVNLREAAQCSCSGTSPPPPSFQKGLLQACVHPHFEDSNWHQSIFLKFVQSFPKLWEAEESRHLQRLKVGAGTSTGRTLIEARPLESPCSGECWLHPAWKLPSRSCIRKKCQHRPRLLTVGPKASLLPVCTAFPKRHCSSSLQQKSESLAPWPWAYWPGLALTAGSPGFKKSFRIPLAPSSSGTALPKLPQDGCYPQAGSHMEQMWTNLQAQPGPKLEAQLLSEVEQSRSIANQSGAIKLHSQPSTVEVIINHCSKLLHFRIFVIQYYYSNS